MPMPFSSSPPALCAADLSFQAHALHVATHRLTEIVCKLAFEGATTSDLDPINGTRAIETLRRNFEGTVEDLRTMFTEALKTPGAVNGTAASLIVALDARRRDNDTAADCRPRSPLLVAMRRVDEVESAERSLILAAQGAGIRIPSPDDFQSGFHSSMAG